MNQRAAFFSLLFPLSLIGCGSDVPADRPPVHAVTGVVSYKGAPVADAAVTFNPEARDGKAAFGRTGPDGQYSLTTFDADDGAVAGKYIVTITKFDTPPAAAAATSEADYVPPEDTRAQKQAAPKSLLPAKYGAMHTSGLTAEVKEDANKFDFTLTD